MPETFLNTLSTLATSFAPSPIDTLFDQDTKAQRVACIAFKAFFWVGWTFAAVLTAAMIFPAIVVVVQKTRSHFKLKATIQALAENRYEALHEVYLQFQFKERNLKNLNGNRNEKINLREQVLQLMRMIEAEAPRKPGLHDRMQEFRSLLNQVFSSEIYKRNKDNKGNFYISFLQSAAHALVSESPGMKPLQEFGKEAAGDVSDVVDYAQLADILKKAVDEETVFKKNGIIGKVFWSFVHPHKFLETALDQLGLTHPLSYNSYEHGNASIFVGQFHVKKKGSLRDSKASYSLTLAPTFIADDLTQVDRDFGAKRLVQDLEADYTCHVGEKVRTAKKQEISDENLKVLNTPINLHEEKEPDVNLDHELSKVLTHYFSEDKSDLDPKRREQAKRLTAVSLKALEEMIEQPFGKGDFYISQSCKQNIDRGVVVNAATILLADAIWGTEDLREDRIHQIIGLVLMRAGMVDDRAIIQKWFLSLTDLLNEMHRNPTLVDNLQAHFSKKGIVEFKASDR